MFSSDDEVRNATAATLKGMSQKKIYFMCLNSLYNAVKNVFNVKDTT